MKRALVAALASAVAADAQGRVRNGVSAFESPAGDIAADKHSAKVVSFPGEPMGT